MLADQNLSDLQNAKKKKTMGGPFCINGFLTTATDWSLMPYVTFFLGSLCSLAKDRESTRQKNGLLLAHIEPKNAN